MRDSQKRLCGALKSANEELYPYWFAVVHLEFSADSSKLLRDGVCTDFFEHKRDLVSDVLKKEWLSSSKEAYVAAACDCGTIWT